MAGKRKERKLAEYNRKRDFQTTPEPAGRVDTSESGFSYLIQKHAASHLHYDFRLELDGVLLSWAVPKGPSLDPRDKRLAMQTEDHPVEYGSFEGIIPQGEYGGGTVMLWDHGEWEPVGDPRKMVTKGRLRFHLHGEKLKGVWSLVRTGPADSRKWLLLKSRDEEAVSREEWNIVEEETRSVVSGREMEEIAIAQDRVWRSTPKKKRKGGAGARKRARPLRALPDPDELDLTAARKAKLPAEFHPQLATLAKEPPEGSGWIHEIKFDGYRLLARVEKGTVSLITRRGQDWTSSFPGVARAIEKLGLKSAILDGEVVALDSRGVSSFQMLQNSMSGKNASTICYYMFDVPYLEGRDLTKTPLVERKELLRQLHQKVPELHQVLRYSDHIEGDGHQVLQKSCAWAAEGIISKRADAGYVQDRTKTWIKTKCTRRQELVIVGYTEPAERRPGFGALLLAVHDDGGDLVYCGRVGTGFDHESLRSLSRQLKALETETSPLARKLTGVGARGRVHWVEPRLVAEIEFTEWTGDGILRHPSFQGLRLDKEARHVKRERPVEEAGRTARKAGKSGPGKSVTKSTNEVRIAGVRLSNPDKVLFPDEGLTKRMLAEYYASISDWVLPQLVGRPLTLVRCPQGSSDKCFYQKHLGDSLPDPVRGIPVNPGEEPYVVIDDLAGLISLVQMGVLEIHPWGSREDQLEFPDRVVMDLDPGEGVAWTKVVEAAIILREFFAEMGMVTFLKTTGGKGLHVVVPLTRRAEWDEVVTFTKEVADTLVRRHPHRFVSNMSKAKRVGKIFIDYLRNGRGATAVSAYSSRARPGATVATPLRWDELSPKLDPRRYTVLTVPRRLAHLEVDPWEGIEVVRQSITRKSRRLLAA